MTKPFDGGYYLIQQDLMRGGSNKHTSAHPDAMSDEHMESINIIQATPWRINQFILDVMREAWNSRTLLANIPDPEDLPSPGRMDDETWERMSASARADHKYELTKVHERNARMASKRDSFLRRLRIAEDVRDEPSIYFPHFCDFRGRIYPLVQDLHPQGDDLTKSLLMFADGVPLGNTGLYWLAIRLANCAGQDKLPFDERIRWVSEHHDLIIDSARDPLDGSRWWASIKADEPWGLLATCREWDMAHQGDPREFHSHLPVPLDGSANGLQHLSLWGRDPVGARATNCSKADQRYDLYTEVAEVVKDLCKTDAAAGSAEAVAWLSAGIERKTVKRAVMTTPYGVTDRGIRDQLMSDGHVNDVEGNRSANADYMKDKIIQALSATVTSAKDIMAWLQIIAFRLAERDIPFRWVTPTGLTVVQSYYHVTRKKVSTLSGEFIMWDEDPEIGLDKRKQMLAAAPNVIHSYDAAHLAKTVLSSFNQGITSFAMIHDSFGTHAGNTSELAITLRKEMASMYQGDVIEAFENYVRTYAPEDFEFPERPKMGSFDPSEVLSARYFFA